MDRASCRREGDLSINALKQSVRLIDNNILPNVSLKHKNLFKFGISAFSLAPFSSLNSNARMIVENESTALSKVYRLVSNQKILDNFPKLLKVSNLVNKGSLVNVDFSTFCGFETLAFGLQTNLGRAIPIWNNCLTYPIKEVGSQNAFVISEIIKFGETLGFYPGFVFDRGFWIPDMIKFFLEGNITFYLRIKSGKQLKWSDSQGNLKNVSALKISQSTKDTTVTLNLKDHDYKNHQYNLRLIVSPPPPKQTQKGRKPSKERWYILTNDLTSIRKKVLDIYRHRFEIEETFKDLKHVSRLKKLFIKKRLSFKILLNFVCLSFWISYWYFQLTQLGVNTFHQLTHPKKKKSYFRIWWEEIQRQMKKPLLNLSLPDG